MLWVSMMGRGGVGRGCSLITRLRVCWGADSKARACCTCRSYCGRTVGGYAWHEHRLPRGIVLGVYLFILNRYFLLFTDDVEVCLVCGQEGITRQQTIVGGGSYGQLVPTMKNNQVITIATKMALEALDKFLRNIYQAVKCCNLKTDFTAICRETVRVIVSHKNHQQSKSKQRK